MMMTLYSPPIALNLGRSLALVAAGWLLYLVCQVFYCAAFQRYVLESGAGLVDAAIWVMREWGLWLMLAPAGLYMTQVLARKTGRLTAGVAAGISLLAVALTFRVGLDLHNGAASVLASIVYHAPRNLAALAFTVFGCCVLGMLGKARAVDQAPPVVTPVNTADETLLVAKGARYTLIRIDRIDSIRTADNYVEIDVAGQTYLLRTTLNALQARLDCSRFVRIHRCCIVSMTAIDGIRFLASGNGIVHMKDGRALALSKKYARDLRQKCSGAGQVDLPRHSDTRP